MEEVLSTASDQLLRLGHIEDMVKDIHATLSETRDEMQAGLLQVSQQQQAPASKLPKTEDSSVAARLDELETQVGKTQRKMQALLLVGIVQLALIVVLAVMAMGRGGGSNAAEAVDEIEALPAAEASPSPSTQTPSAPDDDKADRGGKKKKPKRR